MRLVIVTAFAVATGVACAEPNLPSDPEPVTTSHSPSKAAPGAKSSGAAPAPSAAATGAAAPSDGNETAGAGSTQHWRGEITATTPVDFGGAGYCNYRITLKQVTVDVTLTEKGEVLAATVTAIADEALRSSCPSAAIPTNMHTYELGAHASSTVLPSGAVQLVLAPAAANQPQASLVLEGDFRTTSAAVSLAWSRTDVGPPVDWKINANVIGSRQ